MKNALPAEVLGEVKASVSGRSLSLRQALFREQQTYGLIVTDSEGRIIDWSAASTRIFGYERAEVIGQTPSIFHRPNERPELTAQILASVERDGFWAGETGIVRKDGSEGVTDTVVFAFRDDNGQPATIGINRDITESKQIEGALRETVERLQIVTDNVPAVIAYFDADQRYRFVNEATVQLVGKPRELMLGRRISEVLEDEFYARLEPYIVRALDGEQVTFEGKRKAPDGGWTNFQSSYHPHLDEQGRTLGCYLVSVDITARKRSETEARENENRLRLVTDNIAATILYFDAEERYRFVNRSVRELYGLGEDELIGRTLLEVQGEASYGFIEGFVKTALAGEEVTFEQERTSYTGRRRHYQTSYLPDIDSNGAVNGVYAVLTDITERKAAENILEDSERRLRLITDNMPANIIYFDTERRFQFVNKGVEDHYGRPREEFIGKRAHEIQGDEMYREVGPMIERALAGEEVVFDQERIAGDGSRRHYQSIYLPHLDEYGDVVGCYALSLDITARTRSQAELRENEQRLRLITDNVAANITYLDTERRYRFVNKGFADLLNMSADDIIGRTAHELQGDEVYGQVAPYIEMALQGQEVTFERSRPAADGATRMFQSTYLPHCDEAGNVLGVYGLSVDITERKKAETAARENEARLRLITDNISATIIYFDADQRYRYANKSIEALHGGTADDLIGRRIADVLGDVGYREIRPHIDAALAGEHVTFEQVQTVADGSQRTFHSTYLPDIDDTGRVSGVYVLLVDITERVEAERELRENEQKLRLITDNLPGHFIYFDRGLRYRYINKQIEDLFGLPREEIIGKHSRDIQGEATYQALVPKLDRVMAGERVMFEQRRASVDGSVRDYQTVYLPDIGEDGQVDGCYVMSVDITERKQAEEELLKTTKAAELLRRIAVAANDADDPDAAIQVSLDELCAYSGWPVGHAFILDPEATDKLVSANLWHLDDPVRFAPLREVTELTTFEPGVGLPGRVVKDTASHWLPSGEPGTRLPAGEPKQNYPRAEIGAQLGIRDGFAIPVMVGPQVAAVLEFFTTEAVERDEHLMSIAEQVGVLVGRVIERQRIERSMLIAKEEAELGSRSKSEFLANMSHELRTPLNAVIGFSEIIKQESLGEIGNPTYREYAGHIYDSGQHLLTLINDILDISKIETGNVSLDEERVDVATIVESCFVMIRDRALARGLNLEMDLPAAPLPGLFADARRIKQALINLLSNAVKFTERGGTVTVKAWANADGFLLQVMDTGIGIKAGDIPKALGRFQQIDSDLNRKYEGTGLGLPLAKALVEQHGGVLDLQSEVGVGTTVTMRLPAGRVIR